MNNPESFLEALQSFFEQTKEDYIKKLRGDVKI